MRCSLEQRMSGNDPSPQAARLTLFPMLFVDAGDREGSERL